MFLPSSPERKVPNWARQPTSTPDARRRFRRVDRRLPIATISTTLHALALEPGLLARLQPGRGTAALAPENRPARLCGPRRMPRTVRKGGRCRPLSHRPVARIPADAPAELEAARPIRRLRARNSGRPGQLFVRDGLWGFKIGERVDPTIYDAGFDFTEGLAAVRTGRCWHFIDPTGAVAIDCSDCNAVKPFANGRAIVVRDGQRLAIGRKELNHLAYLTANNYLYPKNTCSDRVVSRQSEK